MIYYLITMLMGLDGGRRTHVSHVGMAAKGNGERVAWGARGVGALGNI